MHISVFEVMSIYPIDQYQKAIPREMPLHELKKKKFNFMCVSHSWHRILLVIWRCSAWVFYCTERWHGDWMEIMLTDQCWNTRNLWHWKSHWYFFFLFTLNQHWKIFTKETTLIITLKCFPLLFKDTEITLKILSVTHLFCSQDFSVAEDFQCDFQCHSFIVKKALNFQVWIQIYGELHSRLKSSMFCALSQNYQHFFFFFFET